MSEWQPIDAICDAFVEMAKNDLERTISLLCGLLIGAVEYGAEKQGENPKAKIELVGGERTIIINEPALE